MDAEDNVTVPDRLGVENVRSLDHWGPVPLLNCDTRDNLGHVFPLSFFNWMIENYRDCPIGSLNELSDVHHLEHFLAQSKHSINSFHDYHIVFIDITLV